MTWIVDVVAVIILLGALASGLRSGFAATLGALLGLVAGAVAAVWALPWVSGAVDPPWRTAAVIGALCVLLVVGCAIGSSIGAVIRRGADRIHLRVLERLLGGVLGLVLGVAIVTFGGAGLVSAGIPGVSSTVASSQVLRQLDRATPAPVDDAVAQLRSQVVGALPMPTIQTPPAGLDSAETATSAPVDLDDADLARAAQSVARVSGPTNGCGTISTGSGFVVAPDRIVTNAHVVAGVETVSLETVAGMADARVIHFDPLDDIAILRAWDLPLDPLPWAQGEGTPGEGAVVLGFPESGPFTATAARIEEKLLIRGPDIYAASRHDREAYILRSDVRHGNSGGPLITPQGEALGVVFGAGVNDDQTGYALTAAETQAHIDAARDAIEAVDTRECVAQ